jgi:hypothetical protein
MVDPGWEPTHRVPDGGIDARPEPDNGVAPAARLDAGLPVRVVDAQPGWEQIVCSNGWTAWVEAARLEALPHVSAPVAPAAPSGGGASPAEAGAPEGPTGFLDSLNKPGNGVLAGVIAVLASAVLSLLLWPVLAVPGEIVGSLLPDADCTAKVPGSTGMYLCSVWVGLLQIAGGLLALVATLFFRRPLMHGLRKITPRGSGVLVGPMVGTALFGLVFASVHRDTAGGSGLVPQRVFPAVIGLVIFLAPRLGAAMAQRAQGFFGARERIPPVARALLAVAVPLLLSYVMMNQERVSDTALKEQVIVLATMGTGFAALVPRDGDLVGWAMRLLQPRRWRMPQRRVANRESP